MNITKTLEEHKPLIQKYAFVALQKLKKPTTVDLDDLKQEGVLAFFTARKSYDINRGTSFKTWLITCLKQHFTDLVTLSYRKKEVANSIYIENYRPRRSQPFISFKKQNTFDIVQIQFLLKNFTEDELEYVNMIFLLVDKHRRSRRKLAREALGISYEREMKLRRSIYTKIKK